MSSIVPVAFSSPLTGKEMIRAFGVSANGQPSGEDFLLTTAQIAAIAAFEATPTVETVVSNTTGTTLTAAALTGGQINRSGPTAAYTDTTDTAAAIVNALPEFLVGEQFYVVFKNATIYPQTIAAGSGVTLPGTVLVPGLSESNYFATVGGTAASPTVTFTHVGTTSIHTSQFVAAPQATSLATVGNGTITAAGIFGGIVSRGGAQSATAFTDTTDIATNIIPLLAAGSAVVGQSAFFIYQNTTNAPATIQGGTGVTVSGVTLVPANSSAQFLVTYTAAATVTMVGVGVTNNPILGTVTANGSTAVVVSNTAVSPGSQILLTPKTITGNTQAPYISAVTPGTGFSIKSNAGDTTVYNYAILG